MLEIHLYGSLRRYGEQSRPDRPTVLQLPIVGRSTIAQVLQQAAIPSKEVEQIFLNGKLLHTSFTMAPWLGYQTERERLPASGDYWETLVQDGDRMGLFPIKMAILVV